MPTADGRPPTETADRRPPTETALVFLGFVVLAALMTFPLVTRLRRVLPAFDDTILNAWILGWDSDRLRHGLIGVWDAPIFYPYPNTLAFSENLFGIAVLVAPIYWLTGNAVLTYNAAFLLAFAIAGVGMYVLALALTGSRPAAWAAGVCYAFGPYRFTQIEHLQMLATGWLPLVLLGLHQYFATRRRIWLVVFAGAYVLQALSNIYAAYFLLVPVGIIGVVSLSQSRDDRSRVLVDLAVTAIALAIVMAPVAYHYSLVRAELGLVRSTNEVQTFSADLRSYLVPNNTIGLWRWLPTAGADHEKELFPGVFAVLLATVGAIATWRSDRDRGTAWMYVAIALIAVALSLGPTVHVWGRIVSTSGPWGWLYRVVPGWSGMRVPARMALLVMTAVAVLLAYGTRALISRLQLARSRLIATGVVLGALLAEGWAVPMPTQAYAPRGRASDAAFAEWLRDKPAGAVLHLPIRTLVTYAELHHQFVTLTHGHPILNAYSGWDSPLNALLKDLGSPLYDYDRYPAVVKMLRAIGVRYVAIHDEDFNLTQREALEPQKTANGFRASGQLVLEQQLLGVDVFVLQPIGQLPPAPRNPPIAATAFTIGVSSAEDRAPNLVDGNLDTRWFVDQNGDGWIEATFASAADIARIELHMAARSVLDYPRQLHIESTDGNGATNALYDDVPYAEFLRGLVASAAYPAIAIDLPPNQSRTLRIKCTGTARRWWSVHEVRFWQRR